MPSRSLPPPLPPPPPPVDSTRRHVVTGSTCAAFSLLLFLIVCFRKITRKRTSPESSASTPPRSIPYSDLRRATDKFSGDRRLGQGGFGPVFRGSPLPGGGGEEIAVKVMDDSGSLQGEREFQNELLFAAAVAGGGSPFVISAIGFSSDRKRRRMLLVYELMPNGNLQDALLHRKCPELMVWTKRFEIAVDIARGLEFLHGLDQPIIHGDIKPSNVLLDRFFSAKIGDFGLARLKLDDSVQIEVAEDHGSVTESVFDESNLGFELNGSSPASKASASGSVSATPSPEVRHENGGVKDYVMKWIGSEVKSEVPINRDWIGETATGAKTKNQKKKKVRKQLDWWISMDDEKTVKKEKPRPAREWWREEYCEELTKKKKKKLKQQQNIETGTVTDDEMYAEKRKKNKSRNRSRSWSRSSLDWWLEGGDVPKSSGGYSSTPSMRGTVCYVAPETGFGENPSEKCDVYSFGVTLLVLVAGRRPLQVTSSPMAEYQRANLLSWARHLARSGKLLDLVDKNVQGLESEQAVVCITVALLCLQKIPARRPTMKEVVAMLTGEAEPPQLPVDLSPSPPPQSRFPVKSNKRVVR